jgi:hypothetical protein
LRSHRFYGNRVGYVGCGLTGLYYLYYCGPGRYVLWR